MNRRLFLLSPLVALVPLPAVAKPRVSGPVMIDARGADAAALARLERALLQLNYSIEPRAVAAVVSARRRGL